ncbi:hypothetical protein Zmor_004219 [Zophobas morio]|uniref:Uncharacterized protein n=1 Tax=Zophobas morio TaxID=2755281 RepID=A0AA38M153_9CUCU|nr:hypothetical protein Zmor_004219 [Zophobas morio]
MSEITAYKPPSRPLINSVLDVLFVTRSSVAKYEDLNCKRPRPGTTLSVTQTAESLNLTPTCAATRLRITVPNSQNEDEVIRLTRFGRLENIHIMATKTLYELTPDQLQNLLNLGDEKELLRTYTRTFTDWAQFSKALDITFSTSSAFLRAPALLDVALAKFKSALTMVYHTTRTTREVEFRPNRLPDELKPLICKRRRLIRVTMVSQRPEDKLAL